MAATRERQEIGGLDRTIRPKWPMPIKFGEPDEGDTPEAFYPESEWCEITIEDARETQARDYDSGELLQWPSGDPLMVLVVLGTTTRDGEQCSLFIQGKELTTAFTNARIKAEVDGIAPGDVLRVRWEGSKPTLPKPGRKSRAALSPTKLYEAELVPVA